MLFRLQCVCFLLIFVFMKKSHSMVNLNKVISRTHQSENVILFKFINMMISYDNTITRVFDSESKCRQWSIIYKSVFQDFMMKPNVQSAA